MPEQQPKRTQEPEQVQEPEQAHERSRSRRISLRDVISVLAFALGVAAVIKELRKPADQRYWHGTVAGVVPYDFRPPTFERMKARLWNPKGPLLSSQVFGVGWTLNIGAVVARLRTRP